MEINQNQATITVFKILNELFPKNLDILLIELQDQPYWIQWKLKSICILCISLFQHESPKLGEEESKDILQFLDVLDDYTWEHLNVGHWKNILSRWRRLKSIVSLLKVTVQITSDCSVQPDTIIKICDQGLLLGSPFFLNSILSTLAGRLHTLIPITHSMELIQNSQLKNSDKITVKLKSPTLVNLHGPNFIIPRLTNPPLEIFISQYFQTEQPLLLNEIINNWPAIKLWCPEYIVNIGGERTVPVEIGSKYTSDDWTQKLMTINEFVKQFMNEKQQQQQTNYKNLDNIKKSIGYLAQYQLFDQLPELRKDIILPDYCLVGNEHEDNIEINAWFGPAYTLTPTHYDSKHNLLAQVFGTKFIRLFPPCEGCNLYPHNSDSLLFNTSEIDLEDSFVNEKYPNIKNASYSDLYLNPGEVLYIPPKWWHTVQSLSPSFSVSFWFQ